MFRVTTGSCRCRARRNRLIAGSRLTAPDHELQAPVLDVEMRKSKMLDHTQNGYIEMANGRGIQISMLMPMERTLG